MGTVTRRHKTMESYQFNIYFKKTTYIGLYERNRFNLLKIIIFLYRFIEKNRENSLS